MRNYRVYRHQFPKHHTIFLRDFNAKAGRQDIFKLGIRNESLHEIADDNGVRVVNTEPSKNLILTSITFLHRNIHKYPIFLRS